MKNLQSVSVSQQHLIKFSLIKLEASNNLRAISSFSHVVISKANLACLFNKDIGVEEERELETLMPCEANLEHLF